MVFRIGHLGDTLVSLPAFWAIRNTHPNAKMTLLTNADPANPGYISATAVLPKSGLFDEWLTYPQQLSGPGGIVARFKLAAKLWRRKFDAAVYLMPRSRTAAQVSRDRKFFRMCGIENFVGSEYLLANAMSEEFAPEPVESESSYLLNCVTETGFADPGLAENKLLLDPAEIDVAESFIRENTSGAKLVAVGPGSKWPSKVWDEDRFAITIERLIEEFGVFPIIFGGPEDREKGERFIKRWKTGANAARVLNIRQAAAALEKCKLYVGNDTGTMHLAAAAGIRCVAIFAAIDRIGRWDPIGSGHVVLRRRVECEGCHSPTCFNNGKCLDLVSIDDVHGPCREILAAQVT